MSGQHMCIQWWEILEEHMRSSGLSHRDCYELPCGCCDLNHGTVEEHGMSSLLSHLSAPQNLHSLDLELPKRSRDLFSRCTTMIPRSLICRIFATVTSCLKNWKYIPTRLDILLTTLEFWPLISLTSISE